MKFMLALSMLGSLLGAFLLIQLGFAYHYEGSGLHPLIAGIGFVGMIGLGWMASGLLATLEE